MIEYISQFNFMIMMKRIANANCLFISIYAFLHIVNHNMGVSHYILPLFISISKIKKVSQQSKQSK